jgi:predicted tellurium resistance membrane protein TerC
VRLLLPEDGNDGDVESSENLWAAIKTILIADLVMSLDNVIAVAAAAKGSLVLLILGLAISIPLVVFGATMLMKIMDRYPIIITIGAGLLGWVAGDMAATDPVVKDWVDANAVWLHWAAPAAGAVFVVAAGKWLAARAEAGRMEVVDLGEGSETRAPH